jgi:hypothetical protein
MDSPFGASVLNDCRGNKEPMKKREKAIVTTAGKVALTDVEQYSALTSRKHLIWFNGAKHELNVFRIPTKYLHFNIQNGRYADKMIQLRADNPAEFIDPSVKRWRDEISKMLRGEYPGTQEDREPWERLREDLKGKSQLTPGVVIADGGVIDGNRRLSVLLSLAASENNSAAYQYFEGVILPENVTDEDRWRIEAGIQLGKDEKHDYSSINKILKIKEGLKIFGEDDNGILEMAKALYGTTDKEIRQTINQINLIDEYLIYLDRRDAYNEVAGLTERFVEAVNTLEAATASGMDTKKRGTLKVTLFVAIKEKILDNWQMRQIRTAISPPKKEKSVGHLNEKILTELLNIDLKPSEVKAALRDGKAKSALITKIRDKAEKFIDQREILGKINEPMKLAESAKSNLDALQESLKQSLPKHPERDASLAAVDAALDQVIALAKSCQGQLKKKTR